MLGTDGLFLSANAVGLNSRTGQAGPIVSLSGDADAGLGALIDQDTGSTAYHSMKFPTEIIIEYSRPKIINKVGFFPRGENLWDRRIRDFRIMATNGGLLEGWNTIFSAENPYSTNYNYDWHYFQNSIIPYKLWKLLIISTWGSGYINFNELRFVEAEETASEHLMYPWLTGPSTAASASSTFDGSGNPQWDPYRAFDGNASTAWASQQTGVGVVDTLEYDFGSPKTVLDYSLRSESNNSISAWQLRGYNGSSWVTIDSRVENIGGMGMRHYQVTNPMTCNKFQLYCTGKSTAVSWVHDLVLYGR